MSEIWGNLRSCTLLLKKSLLETFKTRFTSRAMSRKMKYPITPHSRSTHRKCSVKKGVLNNFTNFTGKQRVGISF